MKRKISVIVPIYNVAPYLPQCLDSLCGQTYPEIEIIGVDDGSTDGSGALLDEYAAKDKRIIAVHQKNAGVSAARNAGMAAASGDYLAFVDGDDWLDTHAYEEIMQQLGETLLDMVLFRHVTVFENEMKYPHPLRQDEIIGNPPDFAVLVAKHSATVWNKLFRTEFIRKNGLQFTPGVRLGEDGLFNIACFACHPGIRQLDGYWYFYRMFRQGATTSVPYGLEVCEKTRFAYENAPFYAALPREQKIIVDLKNCADYLYRFHFLDREQRQQNLPHIQKLLDAIAARYSERELKACGSSSNSFYRLRQLLKCGGELPVSFGEKLFSVKNSRDRKYKIIRILGLEFRCRRRSKQPKGAAERQ